MAVVEKYYLIKSSKRQIKCNYFQKVIILCLGMITQFTSITYETNIRHFRPSLFLSNQSESKYDFNLLNIFEANMGITERRLL